MKAAAPLCPPAVLAGIADLELVARIVVEGLVSGLHRSPFHGYTAEFSQYRHYQPGDDLKYVDWKLAARTDRIYTKQFRETTNMAATLVVDASASMEFPPAPEISKHRYAVVMAAALAHLISRQGDAIGLLAGGDASVFLPARTGRSHLTRLLAALASLKTSGAWSAAASIRRAAERLTRRGLILVLSDLYDDEDAARAELRRAVRQGHEVVVFQVVSRSEIEFSYRRNLEVVDLESGRTVAVDAAAARREYKDALAAFLERWRTLAGREGIQYSLVVTDTPPERALRSFLLSRR
jgi:uncharacterized protein (DUF58 family)